MNLRIPRTIFVSLLAFALAGCEHYQLGRTTKPPFHTVFIEPIRSESYLPQAQALLSDAVARSFAADGTVTVTSKDFADADVLIVITDYHQTMAANQASDTARAVSYEVVLEAKVSVLCLGTDQYWIKDVPVSASTQVFTQSGYVQENYQAIPILTRDLADTICQKVISAW